jgi:hypothetical protein|tara:strand:- start:722 stop:1006 length:285 start_codon:yes stop_codon:yes gene_type:complete
MLPKKDIIDFIKRYDNTFKIKQNIYYATRAFKTNSVINYLGEMKDTDNLNYDEAEQVFNLLIKYLKGEADVIWEDGRVLFKLIEGDIQDEQQDS